MRKSISVLTLLCILLCVFPASASAKAVIADTEYTCTATSYPAIYTFTPDKTAIYALYMEAYYDNNGYMCNPKIYGFSYDALEVMYSIAPEEYTNNPYIKNYYIMEAGKTYTFELMNEMDMNTNSFFSKAKFKFEAASDTPTSFADNTTVTLPLDNTYEYSLFTFTSENGGDLYLESENEFGFGSENTSICGYPFTVANTTVTAGDPMYVFAKSVLGSITLKSSYLPAPDNSTVYVTDAKDLKSDHKYLNNTDKKWIYKAPEGTAYCELKFKSFGLTYSDYLYVYDKNGNKVKTYTYKSKEADVCAETIFLPGDTFTVHLVTDKSNIGFGFEAETVNTYSALPAPVADKTSGTMRPNAVTLTAYPGSKIYYRTSSFDEFTLYSAPVVISESCTLEAYAERDGIKSPITSYTYEIDASAIDAPTFTVTEKTDSKVTFTLSAPEGTIYYKFMGSDSSYRKYTSGKSITIYGANTIVAYALSGETKSPYVYYYCDTYYEAPYVDRDYYSLTPPTITKTPVMGGYEVTVAPFNGSELHEIINEVNVCDDHMVIDCGSPDFTHKTGAWSSETDMNYLSISCGTAENLKNSNCTEGSNANYLVTENTMITAAHYQSYSKESGTWRTVYGPVPEDVQHSRYNYDDMDMGITYTDESYASLSSFAYIEVEKAGKPVISVADGTAIITAEDNLTVYYSLNGSEFAEYTKPFTVTDTDSIEAYAIGMGVAKSNSAFYGIGISVDGNGKITLKNGGSAIENAQLIVATEQGGSLDSATAKTVTVKNGITEITGAAVDMSKTSTVYLWSSSFAPLAKSKSIN